MKRSGFTLLELIVVIIIIGILATLGFTQYTKMVEKGRTGEAKTTLGQIRSAQETYNQEYSVYATDITAVAVNAPTACITTHYFYYAATNATATATRCTTTAGKSPAASSTYTVTTTYSDGIWGGSAGYY